MARVVVLGAGISGHTAALYLRKDLKRHDEVVVVSPNSEWNWIPSNIWVGVGKMDSKEVTFPLRPVYKRKGIDFRQARATVIHPEGDLKDDMGYVEIIYTDPDRYGEVEEIRYDYLINATGPKLNFEATPGLGPDGYSLSVCTVDHAAKTALELERVIDKLKQGIPQTLVIGVGHGTCTCEGAAFEYAFNVEHELRANKVRDLAEVIYITNEYELGDFGVGGMQFASKGFVTNSKIWTESLFRERNVKAIVGAHVERVEQGVLHYEQLDGTKGSIEFDFAMLLPPFKGVGLTALDRNGDDITDKLFAPNGFLKVDADYSQKSFDQWRAEDWPSTYQSPFYDNLFGVGIAFAPPHPISMPRFSPNGTPISPAPPRTGMPSGVMGRTVAETIVSRIETGDHTLAHRASMASMGAACVASAGTGLAKGTAAAMTMSPVVPDFVKYPETGGRNIKETTGEIGLGAHWTKLLLHYLFIYKAKALPGWHFIPE